MPKGKCIMCGGLVHRLFYWIDGIPVSTTQETDFYIHEEDQSYDYGCDGECRGIVSRDFVSPWGDEIDYIARRILKNFFHSRIETLKTRLRVVEAMNEALALLGLDTTFCYNKIQGVVWKYTGNSRDLDDSMKFWNEIIESYSAVADESFETQLTSIKEVIIIWKRKKRAKNDNS